MKKSNTELSFTSDVAQIRKYSLIPTTQFNLISSLSMKRKRRNSCKNLNIIPSQSEIVMKNTIKSISKQIIIKESKNNNGSLYSLFSSSLFNINMLLFYLDTKNDSGIISTLVNMLYREEYKKEAYFYLPQIIAIYLNKKNCYSDIEEFLLKTSIENFIFGLKTYFIMNDYMNKTNKVNIRKINDFLQRLNHRKIKTKRNSINKDLLLHKVSYLDKNISFYKEFIQNMNSIKIDFFHLNINQAEIIKKLVEIIKKANIRIQNLYKISNELKRNSLINNQLKNLYRGYILTSYSQSKDIMNNELIVNIIADFSSFTMKNKSNIELKLKCECIKIFECEKWDELYIDKGSDDIVKKQENNNNDLKDEKNMKFNPFEFIEDIDNTLKAKSSFKKFTTYHIKSFILKTKNELTNEYIINQLIHHFNQIFKNTDLPLSLLPYDVIQLSSSISLIEKKEDMLSIKDLNAKIKSKFGNLNSFFRNFFCNNFEEAQKNFTESLCSCCLFSYLFNSQENLIENTVMDKNGRINLYTFEHLLSTKNTKSPIAFALHKDFIDIMDGEGSGMFQYFKSIIIRGMIEIKKHFEIFEKIIDIVIKNIKINKFSNKDSEKVISALKERFFISMNEINIVNEIENMIYKSNHK